MDDRNGGEGGVALFQGFVQGYLHPFAAASRVGIHFCACDHICDRNFICLANDLFADIPRFLIARFNDHVQKNIGFVAGSGSRFVPPFKIIENFGLADNEPLTGKFVAKRMRTAVQN